MAIVVDLAGKDGNAFVLIGIAKNIGRELGYTKEQHDELRAKMISGDYNNLISVMKKEFVELIQFDNDPTETGYDNYDEA